MKPTTTLMLLTGTILILFTVACGPSAKELDTMNMEQFSTLSGGGIALEEVSANQEPPSAPAAINSKEELKVTEQKLIKNGSISFETKALKDTKAFLQRTVLKYKGYISNEQLQDYRINPTEIITIRVPNAHFDQLIHDIESQVGEFDSKQITIDDVTAEFVDIEARLKNKKQLESKYQELLARAGNMTDILKIEKEISFIREDTESTEGRLRYLSNQVGFSTLSITYYEHQATAGFHFGGKMGEALADGGMSFLWFVIGLTRLWPLWIIVILLCFTVYKMVKRRRKTKASQKTIQQN